jgi:hypothetical protein
MIDIKMIFWNWKILFQATVLNYCGKSNNKMIVRSQKQ